MKRLSVIEKAGSPTASAIIMNRGKSFLEHTGTALRVHTWSTSNECLRSTTSPKPIIPQI
jgi:hypothetical protein